MLFCHVSILAHLNVSYFALIYQINNHFVRDVLIIKDALLHGISTNYNGPLN